MRTQQDRENEIRSRLYSYHKMIARVNRWRREVSIRRGADESGVRGSRVSNPTARMGERLADPPRRIKTDMMWIEAINDAWAECNACDEGNRYGLAFIMGRLFCLAGKPRPKSENAEARKKIAAQCKISERALYAKVAQIVDIVEYHAARRGLV